MEGKKSHGSTGWRYATSTEMVHLYKHDTFKYLDKASPSSVRYNKIWFHLVNYAKHDKRHKAMLVSDGHLTAIPF